MRLYFKVTDFTQNLGNSDQIRFCSTGEKTIGWHEYAENASRAVPAPPHLVRPDRPEEVNLPEPWPVHIRKVQLGIGQLPEQEIGDSLLARGPENEIGIGHVLCVEKL